MRYSDFAMRAGLTFLNLQAIRYEFVKTGKVFIWSGYENIRKAAANVEET